MIRQESVFKIGHITKHRGLKGEVEMRFTDDCFDTGTAEYLVLDMDGILVPFFWEEYSFKNDETAILKFEEVNDEAAARRLVHHSVYYPKEHVCVPEEEEGAVLSSYKALVGFTVSDVHGHLLGTVVQVDDSSQNTLLIMDTPAGNEIIIPFHNDFLCHFDLRQRTLQLDLPEGLLALND